MTLDNIRLHSVVLWEQQCLQPMLLTELKASTDSASLICWGRLFHKYGPREARHATRCAPERLYSLQWIQDPEPAGTNPARIPTCTHTHTHTCTYTRTIVWFCSDVWRHIILHIMLLCRRRCCETGWPGSQIWAHVYWVLCPGSYIQTQNMINTYMDLRSSVEPCVERTDVSHVSDVFSSPLWPLHGSTVLQKKMCFLSLQDLKQRRNVTF